MNQSLESDAELVVLLKDTMHKVAQLAPDMQVVNARHNNRWMATAAAAVVVIVGGVGTVLVAGNRSNPVEVGSSAEATELAPSGTASTSDTVGPNQSDTSPSVTPITIPDVFPEDVPRPDTFGSMTKITWDNLPVGWQFLGRAESTDSVEQCTQYAGNFDEGWTSTAITTEAASVLYARYFDNAKWHVGIYCTDTGDYLVQVMPSTARELPTIGTVVAGTELRAPSGTASTSDTVGPNQSDTSPSVTPITIPDVFPEDVPRPDTFGSMTKITWDNLPVGWQFLGRAESTDSVEQCTQYAGNFDEGWTSTAITTEAASVLYARYFDNAKWRVGIYCTDTGDYLVQVMPSTA